MKTREVSVIGRSVYGNGEVELIRTSVGIDQMHVLFDSAEWVAFGAVSVTFKNSADTENPITTSITPTAIDSPDWSAEATCLIPWEVIQDIGSIAVTFQATDSSSNHIITARAENVLSVIEAGDVNEGTVPSTAPTLSEWEQAYADAMAAASSAADAAAQVEAILDSSSATTLEELLEELKMSLRYKGSVNTYLDLPNDASFGDTYNVVEAYGYYPPNTDYAWTGTAWNALGGEVAIDEITPEDVANIAENPSAYIDGDLPDGAKRLEYIVSGLDSQTQMAPSIDTGIACNAQNLRVEVKYENGAITNGFLFGDLSIPENATFAARYLAASNSIEFESGGVVWSTGYIGVEQGIHTVSLLSSGTGYVDGVEYAATETIGTNPSTTIKLCGTSEAYMSGARALRGKLYYARIWVDGALALDLVPAIANDVACMYDRVSGDFFASTTSRAFTAGPELNSHLLLSQSGFAAAWIEAENEFANKSTATTSTNGLMSSADKSKLDGIENGANNYELPLMSDSTRGGATLGTGLRVDEGSLSLGDVVTDSCDGPIFSVDAEGWSEQVSTTGKNLLPNMLDGSTTIDSVTITKSDGRFTLSGTSSSSGGRTNALFRNSNFELAAGTYSFSRDNGNIAITPFIQKYSDNAIIGNDAGSFTITEATTVYLGFNLQQGVTYNAESVAFQLESGSTATEWEPYSGAAPSPSPEFPQTIEVCRGRNLLQMPTWAEVSAVSIETGYRFIPISLKPNTTYYLSTLFVDSYTKTGHSYVLVTPNKSINPWRAITHEDTPTGHEDGTLETGSDGVLYIAVRDAITQSIYNEIVAGTRPQLELGSTPTPYVPYGCVGLEVQGRNLLPAIATKTVHSIQFSQTDNGIKISGTSSQSWAYITIFIDTAKYIGETLTIAASESLPQSVYANMVQLDVSNSIISGTSIDITSSSPNAKTVTIVANCAKIRVMFGVSTNGTTVNAIVPLQLELGSTAHTYEPYHHTTIPIPLPSKGWAGGLPDGTADELAIDSAGRWEWTLPMIEATVSPSNVVNYYENGNVRHLLTNLATAAGPGAILGNKFTPYPSSFSSVSSESEVCGINSNGTVRFNVNASRLSSDSLEGARTWVSENQITLMYALATPTTEHGYVDLPMDIPEGSTITIPELENTNVRCFVHGAAELAIHAANWGHRNAEMESRLATLEATVAELATA